MDIYLCRNFKIKSMYCRVHCRCLTDIQNKHISLQYIETENNLADFLTKPLQGGLFIKFRNAIMNASE